MNTALETIVKFAFSTSTSKNLRLYDKVTRTFKYFSLNCRSEALKSFEHTEFLRNTERLFRRLGHDTLRGRDSILKSNVR